MINNLLDPQLAVPAVQSLTDRIFKICDHVAGELKQTLHEDINKYIGNSSDKYSKIKTFLFNDRVLFYDVYFPLSLKINDRIIEVPEKSDSLFEGNNFIVILGHAGCGKTMIMKHLFLSACNSSSKLPIVIELRKLKEYNGTLKEYISDKVFNFKLSQNNAIFQRMLDSGSFMFLFDGYDEISFSQKDIITHDLEDFVDQFPHNYYLLTSRPGAGAENLERFENYRVIGLSQKQVKDFIDKQLSIGNIEENKELAEKIKIVLFETEGTAYMRYMSSPLLLSMFILTFNEHPELPKRKSSFYYNVFDTLHSKHDAKSKAGGYQHEKKTKLNEDEIRKVLEAFCFVSYLQSTFEFSNQYIHTTIEKIKGPLNLDINVDDLIYDLSVSVSLLIQDGTSYVFPHRSLQEFFAASYIANSREDTKERIYRDRFKIINNIETHNFWELCEELDESCFVQYFLIPNLEGFYNDLCKFNDKKLSFAGNILYNYLYMADTTISSSNLAQFTMSEKVSLGYNLMRYIRLDRFPSSKLFSELQKLMINQQNDKRKLFIRENKLCFDIQDKRDGVISFYDESGILKYCEYYVNLLKQKIEEKKKLLKTLRDDSAAILNLL